MSSEEWKESPVTNQLRKRLDEYKDSLRQDLTDFSRIDHSETVEQVGIKTVVVVAQLEALETLDRFIEELDDTSDG